MRRTCAPSRKYLCVLFGLFPWPLYFFTPLPKKTHFRKLRLRPLTKDAQDRYGYGGRAERQRLEAKARKATASAVGKFGLQAT